MSERALSPLPVARKIAGRCAASASPDAASLVPVRATVEALRFVEQHVEQTPRFAALRALCGLLLDDQKPSIDWPGITARTSSSSPLSPRSKLVSARLLLGTASARQAGKAQDVLAEQPAQVESTWQTELLRHRIFKTRSFVVEADAALQQA